MSNRGHPVLSSVVRFKVDYCGFHGLGSGFAVSDKHVLTAGHVVGQKRPSAVSRVTLWGGNGVARTLDSGAISYHPVHDMALLAIGHDWRPVQLSTKSLLTKTALQVVQPWKCLRGKAYPFVQGILQACYVDIEDSETGESKQNIQVNADVVEGMSGAPMTAGVECVGMLWGAAVADNTGVVLPSKDICTWLGELGVG